MAALIKFLQLSHDEREVFLRSWILLICMTFLVRFSLLKTALKQIDRIRTSPEEHSYSHETLARWIQSASRFTPGSACLSQALAGCALMKIYGHHSTLMIGVKKDAGIFDGHAWVECKGKVLIGGPAISHQPMSAYNVTPTL